MKQRTKSKQYSRPTTEDLQFFHQSAVVYISGPMTGRPDFNRKAFFSAEERLVKLCGCKVLNPARITDKHVRRYHSGLKGHALYREYIRHDLDMLFLHASAVLLLDGWQDSKGARAEHALAQCLNLDIIHEEALRK